VNALIKPHPYPYNCMRLAGSALHAITNDFVDIRAVIKIAMK
jgi:hypothetical protein